MIGASGPSSATASPASADSEDSALRNSSPSDAAAVAFGETYVKHARNGGPKSFRGTIVAASEDDCWDVKYDADGVVYETEAQHLTLVSPPSKKRAAAATPKKAKKKARKVLV